MAAEAPILEYGRTPRSPLPILRWCSGLPGAAGIVFIYPRIIPGAGGLLGPAGLLAVWIAGVILAAFTAYAALNYQCGWFRWPRLLVDVAWIVLTVLPPGCCVLFLMVLEAFGVPYWASQ